MPLKKPQNTPADLPPAELQCTLCGRCLEVCPLFLATGREELSARAKHFLAARLQDKPGELRVHPAVDLARLCLSCGRCQEVCPVGLSAAEAVAGLRAKHPDFEQWLWRAWVEHGGLLWPSLAALARAAPEDVPNKRLGSMVGMLKAMDSRGGLDGWLTVRPRPMADDHPVVLFSGCTAGRVLTAWRRKAESLLRAAAPSMLDEPGWSCCGATLGHAGAVAAREKARRKNVELWRSLGRPRLVTFCATCRSGLLEYAKDPGLGFEQGEAERWRQGILPLSGLLMGADFNHAPEAPGRVLYHRPCHEAGDAADLAFLKEALGDRLVRHSDNQCCGMGGVLQLGAPDLSRLVAERCWEFHDPRPGDQVLTGCSGCVLQLRSTAPEGVRVGHWLEILQLA